MESQNGWVGRDHGQGHLPLDWVIPSPIQPDTEPFQGWELQKALEGAW